ncbi:hypothetical protein B0H63DRAFT_463188 [Podospora didyma]|uniref:Uncharacterized protein n=1 Tax=Podospora didyma TaxID=330526 RepID=A0AAE0U3F8_9PEZI|nr:hypothetical protein B0H63DRAFT_463188 [Podospora didyma]
MATQRLVGLACTPYHYLAGMLRPPPGQPRPRPDSAGNFLDPPKKNAPSKAQLLLSSQQHGERPCIHQHDTNPPSRPDHSPSVCLLFPRTITKSLPECQQKNNPPFLHLGSSPTLADLQTSRRTKRAVTAWVASTHLVGRPLRTARGPRRATREPARLLLRHFNHMEPILQTSKLEWQWPRLEEHRPRLAQVSPRSTSGNANYQAAANAFEPTLSQSFKLEDLHSDDQGWRKADLVLPR